jgi:hypothetical protein
VLERDSPHIHTDDAGKGYTLYVHNVVGGKRYTSNVHNAGIEKGHSPRISKLLVVVRE